MRFVVAAGILCRLLCMGNSFAFAQVSWQTKT